MTKVCNQFENCGEFLSRGPLKTGKTMENGLIIIGLKNIATGLGDVQSKLNYVVPMIAFNDLFAVR